MKNLLEKLKGLDYKQIAIAHAEKLGAGIVLLLVLLVLVGSRYRTYPRTPEELKSAAEDARKRIESADWPKEKMETYKIVNYLTDSEKGVKRLHTPIEVAKYRYSVPISWPLYRKKQRIKEPVYYPVEELIADAGRTILSKRPDSESLELVESESEEGGKSDEPEFNEFSRRGPALKGNTGAAAGQSVAPGDLDGLLQTLSGTGSSNLVGQMLGLGATSSGGAYCDYVMAANEGPYRGFSGLASYGTVGEARRYVAVRGVVNLQKQKEEIARAIGEPFSREIGDLVEIVDFEMQRQKAVAAEDPWSGPWEPVDLQVALDVLEKAVSWDPEPIDIGVTDPVVTMPLPSRVVGYWGPRASHPRVKDFQLTPEELQRELNLNQKLLDQYNKIKAEMPPPLVERKGFSSQVNNLREIREEMLLGPDSGKFNLNQVLKELGLGKEDKDAKSRDKLTKLIQARVEASGRLLLYRYLDFGVDPGNAYRYRVKVKYRNPFYNLPASRVYDPHVAEGQIRETDWSEPTEPVFVKENTSYFVAESSSLSGRLREGIQMDVFEWYPDTGTTIHDQWWMKPGQFVGGRRKTDLLRPTELTFKIEDVNFSSNDLLVDTLKSPQLTDPADHPDLKLNGDNKGGTLGIVDRAVVMNPFGELVALDSASGESKRMWATETLKREREDWEYLKSAEETPAGTAGGAPVSLQGIGDIGTILQDPNAKKAISDFMKKNKLPEPLRKKAKQFGLGL